MALKKKKKIDSFSENLYHYIWKNHRFNCDESKNYVADKLLLSIEGKQEESYFNENIGKAVITSQYLLRDICLNVFTWLEIHSIHSDGQFMLAVYFFIFEWLSFRKCVFFKVVDAAAIIAEAILICDMKAQYRDFNLAPSMFRYIFEVELAEMFFKKGGWAHFEKEICEKYSQLDLRPFLPSLVTPYVNLCVDAELIHMLYHSPVCYPIELSRYYKVYINPCQYHNFAFKLNDPSLFLSEVNEESIGTNKEEARITFSAKLISLEGFYEKVVIGDNDSANWPLYEIRSFFIGQKEISDDESKKSEKKKKKRKQKSGKIYVSDIPVAEN